MTALLSAIDVDHFRIPLPVTLSDSTHGDITHFELVTVRVRDADGASVRLDIVRKSEKRVVVLSW